MISVPDHDAANALVPHTLKEPLAGRAHGPLAGPTFMVKDLFAIAGHKVSNGNPRLVRRCQGRPRNRACHPVAA